MTTTLYREFELKSLPSVWPIVVAFVKANWQAFADKGDFLLLIITSSGRKRSTPQNRYMHLMLEYIAANAWWGGVQYPLVFWKEWYRLKYLLRDEYQTPDGEIIQVYWSTADKDFTVEMCSDFTNKFMADAAQEFGVEFTV